MFCLSMFKVALEKADILALLTSKNVGFEGENWNRNQGILCWKKKLERENGEQIAEKIP